MTKTEVDRFRGILTAKVAELERFTRQRDGIVLERSADQLEEIQAALQHSLAVCNLDREFTQLRDARGAPHVMENSIRSRSEPISYRQDSVLEPSRVDVISLGINVGHADRNNGRIGSLIVIEWDRDDCHLFCSATAKKNPSLFVTTSGARGLLYRGEQFRS